MSDQTTNDTWQARWGGNAIFAALIIIPLLGCVAAVYFDDMRWLILLALWFAFMEGAFLMIPAAALFVSWWLGR